jgi:hypothetical protein
MRLPVEMPVVRLVLGAPLACSLVHAFAPRGGHRPGTSATKADPFSRHTRSFAVLLGSNIQCSSGRFDINTWLSLAGLYGYAVRCLTWQLMQFWELDQDHDFMIDRDDLLRYGGHGLTYRIVDRIFQQVPRLFTCPTAGKMGYEDFMYFILSEEDKTTDASLRYWHRCVDLDDDGVITADDMRCCHFSHCITAVILNSCFPFYRQIFHRMHS